jgi:hypothetical protein
MNLWFMVLKVHTSGFKKKSNKDFCRWWQSLVLVGGRRSIPLETQNDHYIDIDNSQYG